MFLLGHAWQQGLIPLAEGSILRAITLNGEAIAMNRDAFAWGRRAAAFPSEVEAIVAAAHASRKAPARSLDEIIAKREAYLTAYQDEAYAARYRLLVDRARSAERLYAPGGTSLTEAVAKSYFKLLAIKDEYEIARLYSDGSFAKQIGEAFQGDIAIKYHLAPPLLAKRGKDGAALKRTFGPWLGKLFPLLAAGRVLRGTALDPFGYARERRQERRLAVDYEATMAKVLAGLSPDNHDTALALATLPETIRGFGHVKDRNRLAAAAKQAELLDIWHTEPAYRLAAE